MIGRVHSDDHTAAVARKTGAPILVCGTSQKRSVLSGGEITAGGVGEDVIGMRKKFSQMLQVFVQPLRPAGLVGPDRLGHLHGGEAVEDVVALLERASHDQERYEHER